MTVILNPCGSMSKGIILYIVSSIVLYKVIDLCFLPGSNTECIAGSLAKMKKVNNNDNNSNNNDNNNNNNNNTSSCEGVVAGVKSGKKHGWFCLLLFVLFFFCSYLIVYIF